MITTIHVGRRYRTPFLNSFTIRLDMIRLPDGTRAYEADTVASACAEISGTVVDSYQPGAIGKPCRGTAGELAQWAEVGDSTPIAVSPSYTMKCMSCGLLEPVLCDGQPLRFHCPECDCDTDWIAMSRAELDSAKANDHG